MLIPIETESGTLSDVKTLKIAVDKAARKLESAQLVAETLPDSDVACDVLIGVVNDLLRAIAKVSGDFDEVKSILSSLE